MAISAYKTDVPGHADSKSSQRSMDELKRTIQEIDVRYKSELARIRKKYEAEIIELNIQIESYSRNNGDLGKANKSLISKIKVKCSWLYSVYTIYSM